MPVTLPGPLEWENEAIGSVYCSDCDGIIFAGLIDRHPCVEVELKP